MPDGGMSLNGAKLDWVNGARADGLALHRDKAQVSDAQLQKLGMSQDQVDAELEKRLGDGDVSADDLTFIASLSGDKSLNLADFKAAGFDVTSAQFMFSLAKKADPTTGIARTAGIHTSELPKEDRKAVKAFITELSGGNTDHAGNPTISREAMEGWLGTQLTEANTAPPSKSNPDGGLMYQELRKKGFDEAGATAICEAFHAAVTSKDHGLTQTGSHTETTVVTKQVVVGRAALADADVTKAFQLATKAEANAAFNDRNVAEQNTFATGESIGGPYWSSGSQKADPALNPASPDYNAEGAERHNGLVEGVRRSTASIAKTFAPVVDGQPAFDVDGFHKALTDTFPDAGFTREEAARFLQLAVDGVDTKADCAFMNAFVRKIPALNAEMDKPLWSVVGGQIPPTTDTIDLRAVNCLLALDNIISHPVEPVYETQETGTVTTTVKEESGIERNFSVAVHDGKPQGTLEFKSHPGSNFYGGNQRLK